jgi:hypothetical protein
MMQFIYDESIWTRILSPRFRTDFKILILDRETRKKHLSKFPSSKYTTFKCVMLEINELPVDVINYILYIMIDTDKIHLRLSIVEYLLLLFDIEKLNIEFPKCSLNFWEMQEVILIKMYEIKHYDKNFDNDKLIYYLSNTNYPCSVCKKHINTNMINDVGLCYICDIKLISETGIVEDFKILDNISYEDFKELKKITYYKYLKYDKSCKNLKFVSKKSQLEKKELTNYLKHLIKQEKASQEIYIEFSHPYIGIYNCMTYIYSLENYKYLYRMTHLNKIENLIKILEQEKKNTLYVKNNLFDYIKTANVNDILFKNTVKKEYKFVNKWLLKRNKEKVSKKINRKVNKTNTYRKR